MATSKPSKKDGNWPRLVADVGGTNARFALEVSPLELEHIETLPTKDYDSLHAAIRAYLDKAGQPLIKHAAIAIATELGVKADAIVAALAGFPGGGGGSPRSLFM